ncbi:putative MFS family arabinose efflux permease [Nonomuraea polychroma]|uniref:Putative MFS family arabinose efflux permease n=2 Tax=Nonomuraea polychroma TaxID=46176 RepID=A0A438MI51_9ACTN|nr:putative MFS family arabinose efflux permease [Nonomuraea polychroma]
MNAMAVLTSRPSPAPPGPLSLPRPFWMLWLGTVINRTGAIVQPFLSVYLVQVQGFTLTQAGAVMTAFGAGSLLSHVLAGWLADRLGRRVTLTGGMLAASAAMVGLGAASGFPVVAATAFLLGLTIESYRPASQAMVADLVPYALRPRAYGLLFWAVNLGYSVAMVVGGRLADQGTHAIFGVNAAVAVAFAAVVWRTVPESRPSAGPTPAAGLRAVRRDRLMLAVCAVTMAYGVLYAQAFTTLPLAMAEQGISRTHFGLAMALNGILIIAVQPLAGAWLARRDPCRVLASGTALVAAGFALTALVHDVRGLALTVAIWTAGEIIIAGTGPTIVAALAPAERQGTYAGVSGMSWAAGAVVAPVLGTALLPLGPEVLWSVIGLVGTLSAVGALLIAGPIRRRTMSGAGQRISAPQDLEQPCRPSY